MQLWALLHLLNRGEARQVVVFSGIAVIAGAALMKDLWLAPPAHREVGLLRGSAVGRVDFWREFGWWRPAHALLVYLDLLGCILSRSAPTRSLVGFGKVAALGRKRVAAGAASLGGDRPEERHVGTKERRRIDISVTREPAAAAADVLATRTDAFGVAKGTLKAEWHSRQVDPETLRHGLELGAARQAEVERRPPHLARTSLAFAGTKHPQSHPGLAPSRSQSTEPAFEPD